MDIDLLRKLLGQDQSWHGACTVILNTNAAVQTSGTDAIVSGGTKVYAPRITSGRIPADAVCLLADGSAILVLQLQRTRLQSGEEVVKQFLTVADPAHVVAIEYPDVGIVTKLGLAPPEFRTGSHHGLQKRPSLHG